MRQFLTAYAPALLSGVLLALCFPTWHLYPLAWVALIPLFYKCARLSPRQASRHFFLAGMAFNLIVLQWFLANFMWAGGWAFWGLVLLSIVLSIFWALLGAAWAWLRRRSNLWGGPWSLAILWASMEYLQASVFTGFGWGSLGYTQGKDINLLQWAAIGGAPLISAILVIVNAFLTEALLSRKARPILIYAGAAILVVASSHMAGATWVREADYKTQPFNVGIFQADFPLEMKWDNEYTVEMVRMAATKSRRLAEQGPVDLFLWPEALIMASIDSPSINEIVTSLCKDTGVPLFTGSVRYDAETRQGMNSSYFINEEGTIVDYYDKIHLAPYGEYIPLADYLPFIKKLVPSIGGVGAGTTQKTFTVKEKKFGPLICFEVLFTNMSEPLRSEGADFLVVITNLAWFGASNAIPQELEIARLRAVESRLPIVQCANTGISGVFDPWGRFQHVDGYIDNAGAFYKLQKGLPPESIVMQRRIASIPVAMPGERPIERGPWLAPRLFLLLTVFILAGAALSNASKKKKASH